MLAGRRILLPRRSKVVRLRTAQARRTGAIHRVMVLLGHPTVRRTVVLRISVHTNKGLLQDRTALLKDQRTTEPMASAVQALAVLAHPRMALRMILADGSVHV